MGRIRWMLTVAAAVAAVVGGLACAGDDGGDDDAAPDAPTATTTTAVGGIDAAELYRQNCSACHGLWAEGALTAPFGDSTPAGADLDARVAIVLEGGMVGPRGATQPPFEDHLSPEEVAAVIEYADQLRLGATGGVDS